MRKPIYIIFFILASNISLYSQQCIPFKIAPFGINTGMDPNQKNYLPNISGDGTLTFEPSFQIGYEYYGKENTSLKFIQGIGRDQMKKFYGFSQFIIRYSFILDKKNSLTVGIGPNLQYRTTWINYANYIDEGIYKTTGNTQYKTFWLSGEIEFDHYINKNYDFSISINHTHPYTVAVFVGYKFYITRKSVSCSTCPSYH